MEWTGMVQSMQSAATRCGRRQGPWVSAEELVVDDYERPEVVVRDLDIDEGVWNEAVGVVVVERDEDVVGGVAC